ncbi:MAG: hypothetical protein B6241_06180 [Spirochaetaceae bacterium 4572_59]|nr:MAG: hypothetical protein B6241_06180 [Spirochaetaceae bacterium 4572_59]
METAHLTVHYGSRIINETISKDMTILEAFNHLSLSKSLDFLPEEVMSAPCGGKGTCGKCRVKVTEGEVSPLSDQEKKLLTPDEIRKGIRLGCQTRILGPVKLELESSQGKSKIQASGTEYSGPILPLLEKTVLELPEPSIDDQRSDEKKIIDALPKGSYIQNHNIRKELHKTIRAQKSLTVTRCGDEITSLEPGNTSDKLYALAVDIGTTTVVAYLLNLLTGKKVGLSSGINRQNSFGADVISRIEHIGENPQNLKKLQERILRQIESLLLDSLMDAGVEESDVFGIFIAGNTTMMHIFSGLFPQNMAVAPFIPVSTEQMILTPADIGSILPGHIRFIALPSLSAYIGADIVSGILSTEMNESEEICLLVDIGTNGEIALGNKEHIVTCSTAAGPAFEGANIQCGMGGISGAISMVGGNDGILEWKTIDDKPATGICGSGIIDMAAYLLETGIADYTGRFQDESDWGDTPPENLGFLDKDETGGRFILTRDNKEIFFSQKDLREVQLAKGSIGAGIQTLIKESGFAMDEIKHVYLAGGFGSFIDKESALKIGLLPEELGDRIESVGNSCIAGVIRAALNKDCLKRCGEIQEKAEYLELSSHKGFQEEYIMNMYFPETLLCI